MGWNKKVFSFRGRAGRTDCWIYLAIATPLSIVLILVFWIYAASIPGAYENGGPTPFPTSLLGITGAVLFFAILAAVLAAGTAVTVRRLHDRNKAWWWVVVFVFLPDVLFGLGQYLTESGMPANGGIVFLVGFAGAAFTAWGLIELGIMRGTEGANRFGPDPLLRP